MNELQFSKVKNAEGFIAALDQSGGSTPKALKLYGIEDGAYSGDEEMFDLVHAMRSRIITSPSFNGDRILGCILFEMTMDRQIEGRGSADYLWNVKNVVPFLKVDKGLADEVDGAQVMKPMPGLDALLARAVEKGVFGTKMRSVIRLGNGTGVQAVVDQQVMLKLTLPEVDDFYADLVAHPNVLRVVDLSGGYSREEADARLARQHHVVASFSRALTEGLTVQQSDEEFNAALDASIGSIFQASTT